MQAIVDTANVCASLAELLDYPSAELTDKIRICREKLSSQHPEVCASIEEFLARVSELPQDVLEETYTRTFDMAPICVPYVTSYIYGQESFDRGKLMSGLAEAYSRIGFETGGELPDHIGLLLRFAPFLDQDELADLVQYCLREPLGEMVQSLQNANSPYAPLMRAIQLAVSAQSVPEAEHD